MSPQLALGVFHCGAQNFDAIGGTADIDWPPAPIAFEAYDPKRSFGFISPSISNFTFFLTLRVWSDSDVECDKMMPASWITRRWKRCASVRCGAYRPAKAPTLSRDPCGSTAVRYTDGWRSIGGVDGEH